MHIEDLIQALEMQARSKYNWGDKIILSETFIFPEYRGMVAEVISTDYNTVDLEVHDAALFVEEKDLREVNQ